ncbi:MAG: hypothetical protein ACREEQ_06570, partial [Caulobacteraceae bacterium]
MSSNAPIEHVEDALTLNGDAYIDLFEVSLKSTPPVTVRFWNGPTRTWQGNQYEGLACQMQGEARDSQGKAARPTLTVHNPTNIFGPYATLGY